MIRKPSAALAASLIFAGAALAQGPTEITTSTRTPLEILRERVGKPKNELFRQENTPENLKHLFRRIRDHVRANQRDRAARLGFNLLPDPARVRLGLRPDADGKKVEQITDLHRRMMPARFDDIANIFEPEPAATDLRLYAATTEELRNPPKNSAARVFFPKGAQKVAREILRPGLTWHMVELAKNDQHEGFRYHLIFWDGQSWTMLGPIWNQPR
jgi:ribosomal protein S15P/S13E